MHFTVLCIVMLGLVFLYLATANDSTRIAQNASMYKSYHQSSKNRSFVVDWENDRFLMDDEPFRFIAGSFHYFRAHPKTWQRKLRTMRAAGLNAVTTYVEWSIHNPKDGVYVWDGIADLKKFIEYAIVEDLYVILRPGPYICAERDFGGFPFWLLSKYPGIQLRTADINYLYEVRLWYSQLMAIVRPYLYGKGGPIIMVQVENEYGSYYACDKKYRAWLRDETLAYVKDNAVLFTNDGPDVLFCGHIDGVLATMDFGATNSLQSVWNKLHKIQPKGPLVNAEFYPGWLTHWSEPMARRPAEQFMKTFTDMLDDGASVNFYMFFGGTNFGFTAGANDGGPGRFQPDVTSYDYDAPMDEAGDPTEKYFKIQSAISKYLPLPNITVPVPLPKKNYGSMPMMKSWSFLSDQGRKYLSTGTIMSNKPETFEAIDQFSGMVLYETFLPKFKKDPCMLQVSGLRDRAYVYVNNDLQGILSREVPVFDLPISASAGNRLQILVENQGRINFGSIFDTKGIVRDVYFCNHVLKNWNITKFPMESSQDIADLILNEPLPYVPNTHTDDTQPMLRSGPTVFYQTLNIDEDVGDTYLDTTGWGKGVVFINGENLGRYWPIVGPQITIYIPKEVLKRGLNTIVLIEYQKAPVSQDINFSDKPKLDNE